MNRRFLRKQAFTGRAVPAPCFYDEQERAQRGAYAHPFSVKHTSAGGSAAGERHPPAHRRIDFCCEGVGIEIKKGRPQPAALKKQIAGYLQSPLLNEILVITQRSVPLPETIGTKRVYQLSLDRLWGIAL